MSQLLPTDGEELALEYLVNKSSPQNLVLRLFVNDYTPVQATVVGDLTEASGSGYASKTLTGGSWTVTPGVPCVATYALQTWTFSGALGFVYGYYLTRVTGGELVLAERFPVAFEITTSGDMISLPPTIALNGGAY